MDEDPARRVPRTPAAGEIMRKKTIRDLDPAGKCVFVRVDFNVPLREGSVADDRRVRAALPTLNHLLAAGARLVCASHLGRPGGQPVPELTLRPVADRLSRCLDRPVSFATRSVGPEARRAVGGLSPGDVLLLENVRFEKGEKSNDVQLALEFASLADAYVNDAFGAAHRAHASTEALARQLRPAVAGLLMEKEVVSLSRLLDTPRRPYVAVLGGAKIAGKIDLIENLLGRVDSLVVGGAMAHTFLHARGVEVGQSRVDEERLDLARRLLRTAEERGVNLTLPVDHVTARSLDATDTEITDGVAIPADRLGGDIGPRTVERFIEVVSGAGTVLWNGPLGAFEHEPFARGTRELAGAIRASSAYTVVGGGDSAAALHQFDLEDGFDHISTGGGACLQFLSGRPLPGLDALDNAEA